jgi:hypothetical protein
MAAPLIDDARKRRATQVKKHGDFQGHGSDKTSNRVAITLHL